MFVRENAHVIFTKVIDIFDQEEMASFIEIYWRAAQWAGVIIGSGNDLSAVSLSGPSLPQWWLVTY